MNSLTINGLKLCKACNKDKPLSEFRLRKTHNNAPSYGRCKQCELIYDQLRRRAKGINKHTSPKKNTPIIKVTKEEKRNGSYRMKALAVRPTDQMPIHKILCRECGYEFTGYRNQRFCSKEHAKTFHHRKRRQKERARLRKARVSNVSPIAVFKAHNWICANCGIPTPRHLRGKNVDQSPELDHIIPLSKGGEHSYTNTQLLCRRCNLNKGSSTWNPIKKIDWSWGGVGQKLC